jgi:hypothetical protein
MKTEAMKKVFRLEHVQADVIPSSGHMRYWLVPMDVLDTIGVIVLHNEKGVEFPAPAHREEELIWVLDGQLSYKHGPVINAGEAILILPDRPHPGKYAGRLLVFWCNPFTDAGVEADAMNRVINPQRVVQSRIVREPDGSVVKVLAVTNNMSICIVEAQAGTRLDGTAHPEKEIVYVLKGQIDYDDGRIVGVHEAGCNLPGIPHPGRYAGPGPVQYLAAKSPPDSRFGATRGV